MFEDVLKPFHLQPLKQILGKRIFLKKIFPTMMKKRKYFSSKSGVTFRFILVMQLLLVWVGFGFISGISCCV